MKIYATIKNNIVVDLFSDVFKQPSENSVLIEEGSEEYHAHVHLKYQLLDSKSRYNYKYENGLVLLTEEEKKAIEPEPIKSDTEIKSEILLGLVLRDIERDVQSKKGSV